MTLMDREYLTQPGDVVKRLVGECAGCLAAQSVAADVVYEWMDGKLHAAGLEREYDMRIGERCGEGLIRLSDEVQVCTVDLPQAAEEMPKLTALD